MKCPNCDLPLPEDSEFCQYCGIKIAADTVTVEALPPLGEDTVLIDRQYSGGVSNETTASQLGTACITVQGDEGMAKIGGSATNESATYEAAVPSIDLPQAGEEHKTKKRYCKRCGGLIDPNTKKCQGCGKQYFKIVARLPIIILSLLLAVSSGANILQFTMMKDNEHNISALTAKISRQAEDIASQQQKIDSQADTIIKQRSSIEDFKKQIDNYRTKNIDRTFKLLFYEINAAVVPDDGTRRYHEYGCEHLDLSSGFWIYNTEEAIRKGYRPCKYCKNE